VNRAEKLRNAGGGDAMLIFAVPVLVWGPKLGFDVAEVILHYQAAGSTRMMMACAPQRSPVRKGALDVAA